MAEVSARPQGSASKARPPSGQARSGQARSGQARSGQVRSGQARSGLTGSGLAGGELAPMEVPGRIGRLRELLEGAGCEALLISSHSNIRYLTGFTGSAGLLMVRADDAVVVTDGRYGEQAPAELGRSGAAARAEALAGPEQLELLRELVKGIGRLGLEGEHVSWARYRRWSEGWAKDVELVPTSNLVEGLRLRKDTGEIARVAIAAGIADAALASVRPMLGEGPTEAEVALALDTEMRRLGADEPSFETIVAAGPNAAEPHHHPSQRKIGHGELVVVDFGARVDGYCSDMTRTIRTGRARDLAPELARVAAVVLAAQDAGLCAVRDGVAGAEVDRACREVVGAAGLAELFVHGTGHGVGLDIHEGPALGVLSQDILCSGQVVTVEPGVYVPGLGGARTEDTVLVTGAGCEILTLSPKV
jgi:Xaa-Pro aminopeptidase